MSGPLVLLVLGGTGDARALARRLAADPRFQASVSLAGAVERPDAYALPVRTGGFGGAQGLARFLKETGVAGLVDATHPFAARISANAVAAAEEAGVPLLRLERPPWRPSSGDDWREVDDLDAAAAALPQGARPFLAVGRKEIARFAGRSDLDCLMRMIDPPGQDVPLPGGRLVLARPSDDVDTEAALLQSHGATHVVAKNSGGRWGAAKLVAARRLGLPVIMLRRPEPGMAGAGAGERVGDVAAAMAWLELLAGRAASA
jgi:precorrin-6A/cobalt-precorrin-6A reductase